jgi:putative endonuclease
MLSVSEAFRYTAREILRFAQDDKMGLDEKRRAIRGRGSVKRYYIYIMTNRSKTLYIGVTNNLERRLYEHKHHMVEGFTNKYKLTRLVYFEEMSDVYAAIAREKHLKGWLRAKKIALIESINPEWGDLSEEWQGG